MNDVQTFRIYYLIFSLNFSLHVTQMSDNVLGNRTQSHVFLPKGLSKLPSVLRTHAFRRRRIGSLIGTICLGRPTLSVVGIRMQLITTSRPCTSVVCASCWYISIRENQVGWDQENMEARPSDSHGRCMSPEIGRSFSYTLRVESDV
jgi:hypothetical protein